METKALKANCVSEDIGVKDNGHVVCVKQEAQLSQKDHVSSSPLLHTCTNNRILQLVHYLQGH